ncbi:MAG: hypothetical protein OEZ39_15915 [Gammaproteobacteria bacterium]|nr:hypothetical protein [Gammaproteobacteria bacterium]MDH5653344.1 hypothetical protein [Gammaproteobacteria bacterium]
MKSRLEDLPTFEIRQVTVNAHHYNLVQVALKRLGDPLRIVLPGLRTLDLHLEKEAWIVVDKSLHDIPVMAWIDFAVAHRRSLHEDIPCTLKIYHSHAGILINKVMEAMSLLLGEQLDLPETEPANVVPLNKSAN